MSVTEFLACLLKLMAVFIFILFLKNLPEDYASYLYLSQATEGVFLPAVFTTLFKSIVFVGGAVVLFTCPLFIARLLLPSAELKPIALKPLELVRPGMILLGIYIVTYALPDVIHNTIALLYLRTIEDLAHMHMAEVAVALLVAVVQMLMAVYLIFYNQSLLRLIGLQQRD